MPELRILSSPGELEPRTAVLDSGAVAFSIDEVARILRINRKTVVGMIERGELAGIRYARRRWVPAHVLRGLLLMDEPDDGSAGASSS